MKHSARHGNKSFMEIGNHKRKIEKEIINKEKTKKLKDEMNANNRLNRVLERRIKAQDIEDEENHSFECIPDDWMAKKWPYPKNNKSLIDLQLISPDYVDIPEYLAPLEFQKAYKLPIHKQKRTNPPPLWPRGCKSKDEAMEDRQYKYAFASYSKGPKENNVKVPIMRVLAVPENGCPTAVRFFNWKPLFFIPCPDQWSSAALVECFPEIKDYKYSRGNTRFQLPQDEESKRDDWKTIKVLRDAKICQNEFILSKAQILKDALESQLQEEYCNELKWETGDFTNATVVEVLPIMKESCYGYNFDEQQIFFRITFSLHKVTHFVKKIFIKGLQVGSDEECINYQLKEDMFFNSTLTPEMLFMIQTKLTGMTWFTLPAKSYQISCGSLPEEIYKKNHKIKDTDCPFERRLKFQKSKLNEINNQIDMTLKGELKNNLLQEKNEIEDEVKYLLSKVERKTMELDFETKEQEDILMLDEMKHEDDNENKKSTWCRVEIDCDFKHIQSHWRDSDAQWSKMADLTILSWDIECAGRQGHFPNPDFDSIVSISCVLKYLVSGKEQNMLLMRKIKRIEGFHKEDPNDIVLPNTQVFIFDDEADMLRFFEALMRNGQHSINTGYNIFKFDFPYTLSRARHLGLKTFALLSPYKECIIEKKTFFESAAAGQRQGMEILCSGVIVYDLLNWARIELKLSNYTLNAVATEVLKQTKDDLHYSLITPYFYGSQKERRLLAGYNLKDSKLVMDIIFAPKNLLCLRNTEICRVTGVTFSDLILRGQGIKTESQLHRIMLPRGFLAPNKSKAIVNGQKNLDVDSAEIGESLDEANEDDSYVGASCIQPKIGWYGVPIATMDFQSLYPSIMSAYNLCYSTFIETEEDLARFDPKDYDSILTTKGENNEIEVPFYYVKPHIRKGLLPELVDYLLDQRNNHVKTAIKKLTKEGKNTSLLEARSTALKLANNSSYGFCLVEGTKIALANGVSIAIEDVEEGSLVYGLKDARGTQVIPRTVTHKINQGQKPCIELLFSDGRILKCTKNHKILTSSGDWVEADKLIIDKSKVNVSIDHPLRTKNSPTESLDWEVRLEDSLGFNLSMQNIDQAEAFARIIGYLMTDRSMQEDGGKICMGHHLDVESILRDFKLLQLRQTLCKINEGDTIINVISEVKLRKAAFSIGILPEKRTNVPVHLPQIFTSPNCPLSVAREFLGGLFGVDGHTLHYSNKKPNFYSPGFNWNKLGSCAREQMNIFKTEFIPLLVRLGIPEKSIELSLFEASPCQLTEKGIIQVKKRKREGEKLFQVILEDEKLNSENRYTIRLRMHQDSIIIFADNIGFRHCVHKQMRLSVGSCYSRLLKRLRYERNKVRELADTLRLEGMTYLVAVQTAIQRLSNTITFHPFTRKWRPKQKETYEFNINHQPITLGKVLDKFNIRNMFSEKRSKKNYSAEERKDDIKSSIEIVEDEKKDCIRYGVDKLDNGIPTFQIKLVAKREIGLQNVWDLTVPSTSSDIEPAFLANGILVHNCAGFRLYLQPIAICVCAIGRQNLLKCQNLIESHFNTANGYKGNSKIIYGDSVTADTPILVKNPVNHQIAYIKISELHDADFKWQSYHGDKFENLPFVKDLKVWTEKGWTKINKIIKHKNTKEITRVMTPTGCVDVTSDHSLLTPNAEKITPKELQIKTELLHYKLPRLKVESIIHPDSAYCIGMIFAKNSIDYTDFRASNGIKLLFSDSKENLSDINVQLYNGNGEKKVPEIILNGSKKVQMAFYHGYFAGNGNTLNIKSKLEAAGLYYIFHSLGFPSRIIHNSESLLSETNLHIAARDNDSLTAVKQLIPLGILNEDVYDLETENHHFAAGIGQMIVHNTDSVMVNFGLHIKNLSDENEQKEVILLANEYAEECQAICNKLFTERFPIFLDFEKVYCPYLLMGKKNYAGLKYEPGDHPLKQKPDQKTGIMIKIKPKLDCKGVESVRRDKILFIKMVLSNVLDKMFKLISLEEIVEYIRHECEKLCKDEYEMNYTIQSKQIKVSYAQECVQTKMVELAEQRNMPPIESGDRVYFILKIVPGKTKIVDVCEFPDYALENNIPIDYKLIGEKCCFNAIKRIIYLPLLANYDPEFKIVYDSETEGKSKDVILPEKTQKMIDYILEPFHKKYPPGDVVQKTGINQFMKPVPVCLKCGKFLNSSTSRVGQAGIRFYCDDHAEKRIEFHQQYQDKIEKWNREQKTTLEKCITCVGPDRDSKDCSNRDCNTWWRRKKIDKELAECKEKFKKINLTDW